MEIDARYKALACYRNLTKAHQTCLDRLVTVYGDQLNGMIKSGGSLFTLHDFNHHCYNLYRIINNSLCNVDVDADDNRKLSEHELFLLDMAVLLHDIGMSTSANLIVNRTTHASKSAEIIHNEWRNTSSTLYVEGTRAGLSETDISTLAEIVKAHSDNKEIGDASKTGIYAQSLLEEMPSSSPHDTVRARFLAGILRMADELDITLDRRGNAKLAEQLDSSDADNQLSMDCWEKLMYFSQVRIDNKIHIQLNLVVNDTYVQEKLECSDEEAVYSGLWEVYQKITKEWSTMQKEIFQKTEGGHDIIRVETIEIISTLREVKRYLSNMKKAREDLMLPEKGHSLYLEKRSANKQDGQVENAQPLHQKAQERVQDERLSFEKESKITVLSPAVKADVDTQIQSKKLVTPGHFFMHTNLCARDWINIAALFQKSDLFEKCIQTIARHIQKNMDLRNTVILGIDLNGTLLGVRIAAVLQCPFMFLIPPQRIRSSGGYDRESEVSAYDHAVCISDVISNGITINTVSEQYDLQNKLLSVYTLLYRPPQCASRNLSLELPCHKSWAI